MISIIVFILGLFVGSFLNCAVYRIEIKKSFVKGRSFCPYCKHPLSWQDLIPVFSYIFLRGKCRYCKEKISIQYPLVEILTGFLFLLIFLFFKDLIFVGFLFLISCFLIIIFIYDLKHLLIPDKVLTIAILITLGHLFIFNYPLLIEHILSAIGASFFFLFLVLVSREKWMGAGDAKLAVLIGLLLGFPGVLISLFLSFLIGAIIGIGLVISQKKGLKAQIPFGPFLILGIYLTLFFGDIIANWYLNLFLL